MGTSSTVAEMYRLEIVCVYVSKDEDSKIMDQRNESAERQATVRSHSARAKMGPEVEDSARVATNEENNRRLWWKAARELL